MSSLNEDNYQRAFEQAQAQYQSIVDLLDTESKEQIHEYPLNVTVRSDWQWPGQALQPSEYRILLCCGGPAVHIIGDLDEYSQPVSAHLEYQDWFLPYKQFNSSDPELESNLIEFATHFWFGV